MRLTTSTASSCPVRLSETGEQPMTTSAIVPSYEHGTSDRPLLGETIGENFTRIAAAHADREALVHRPTGRRWTYAEPHRDVLALARGLLRLGIDKGDRVGIWAPNCPEWTILQYARPRSARSWCRSTRRTAPASSGTSSTRRGSAWLMAAPSFRTSDYAALLTNSQSVSPTVTCAADVSLQPGWNRSPGLTRRWQPPAPGYRVVPERADGGWSAAAGDRAGGPQVPGGSGVWLRPGVRRGLAGFGCFR